MLGMLIELIFETLFGACIIYSAAMTMHKVDDNLMIVFLIALTGKVCLNVANAFRKMIAQRKFIKTIKNAYAAHLEKNDKGGNA